MRYKLNHSHHFLFGNFISTCSGANYSLQRCSSPEKEQKERFCKKLVFEDIQYRHSPTVTHRLFPAQILLRNPITYPTD
ncbi:hypothetical protein TNCT_40271 [Trichonephila clavata]|uniref:Uncharacterized protein n=1 Tax=Trichonephila clavata TaxID=2740835 RepID=A0A8X6IAD6_TRICU|nr:hypothetical protein TNCT_40271 [Trichonephila clavata]